MIPEWVWYIAAGSGAFVLLAWLAMNSSSGKVGVRRVPVLWFAKMGGARIVMAENIVGTLQTAKDGGMKEDTASVVIHRYGRVMWRLGQKPPEARRKRRHIYVARQHDPGLLRLAGLFTGSKITQRVLKEDIIPYENLAARQAAADAQRKSTPREAMTRALSIAAVVSIVAGGASLLLAQVASFSAN